MTLLLECREKIKKFYRLNNVLIIPILKFMIAFIALNGVNTMMGYMPKLDNIAIVMILSLACTFLPAGFLAFVCAAFSVGHMFAASLEIMIVGVLVYLLLFLLLFRFAPKDSYVVVLTPLLFALKIPYLVPIAVGLICGPLSAVSVFCGVLVYYILGTIIECAPTIVSMKAEEGSVLLIDKIRYLIERLLSDRTMFVIALSFALTVIVVYAIRRLAVEHAWTIAIVAGVMVNLIGLLIGDFKYDIELSLGSAIFGSILAVLVAMVIQFFRFFVDYARTEKVQFEDDEYYYYVKVVPKLSVTAPTKTVKRINTNTQSFAAVTDEQEFTDYDEAQEYEEAEETDYTQSQAKSSKKKSSLFGGKNRSDRDRRKSEAKSSDGADFGNTRAISTERTARPQETFQYRQSSYNTQSMKVGNEQFDDEQYIEGEFDEDRTSEETEDYEELF